MLIPYNGNKVGHKIMLKRSKKTPYINLTMHDKNVIQFVLTIIDEAFQMKYNLLFQHVYLQKEEMSIERISIKCTISRSKVFHDIDILNKIIKITLEIKKKQNNK